MTFDDFTESVKEKLDEKLGSPMYWDFLIAWCITNWKSIYITFFVSEEYIMSTRNQLKSEYILSLYPLSLYDPWTLWTVFKLLLLPAIATYFVIWWISRIDFVAYKKTLSTKNEKRLEKEDQEKRLLETTKEVIETQTEVLEETVKKSEAKKKASKAMTEEEKWDLDYQNISKNPFFEESMNMLQDCIYKYNGDKKADYRGRETWGFIIQPEVLAFLHTNGIIKNPNSLDENGQDKISLTTKGLYILGKFVNAKS